MAAVLPNPSENARKIAAEILQALAKVGQNNVAEALKTSDSTVSRLKGDIGQMVAMFDHLGFQVVPSTMRCYNAHTIAAIFRLAKERMDELDSPDQLLANPPPASSG
jgi:hypothetical protein